MLRILLNLSIAAKVVSLLVLTVLLFLSVILLRFLPMVERETFSDRKKGLKYIVDMTHSLMGEYEQRARLGEFSREEAQERAKTRIRQLRYGDNDYLWINDDTLPFPRMIMHPTIPDLDGRILDDPLFACATSMEFGVNGRVQDIHGRDKNLFQAFVEVVAQTGDGFVAYDWPRPTREGVTQELYLKQSYVRLFQPWGWIIGTGVYVDDITAQTARMRLAIISVTGMILAAVMLLSVFLIVSILRPMKALMGYAEKVSRGDLDAEISGRFYAETDRLKHVITTMVGRLKQSIRELENKSREAEQVAIEARRAKEELGDREKKLRAITDSARDAVIMIDPMGNISFWNPAAETIFGYSSAEALGQNIFLLLAPERYHAVYARTFQRYGSGSAAGGAIELLARKKDGQEIPIALSLSSLALDDKWHAVGIVRDITERKQAEAEKDKLQAQLLQAQKMESVGILAGGVAHDFNNLLHVMRGNIELLARNPSIDPRGANRLESVTKSLDRATKLVQQLLLFSRKAEVVKEPVEVNQVVREAARMLERTIPRMVSLELHLDPGAWPLFADPVQLEQILLNLANNAVDAMPDGGKLVVETSNVLLDEAFMRLHPGSTAGPHVLLIVTDTGHGMDKAVLDHIFDPFFTTKEVGKGTGLGLASVYGIIKAHGGHIQCYSEPGQGTTFRIYLPAAEQGDMAAVEPRSAAPPQGGSGTILVVDDEPEIRELTQEALELLGYNVQAAATGEEALEMYKAEGKAIDLVLLDLNMPGMGGYRCLQELIKLDSTVRVVIASGYTANAQSRDALSSGAKGFIGKPYQLKELASAAREVLSRMS